MKTETLQSLEDCLGSPSELREAIAEHISSFGITPTDKYVLVMEYLLKNHDHPTVDVIYHSLSQSIPSLSRSMIYSILDILDRVGAINVIHFDKNTIHYDGVTEPHAHFLCERCGAVSDMKMCENLSQLVSMYPDISIRKVHLHFTGRCQKCLAAKGK